MAPSHRPAAMRRAIACSASSRCSHFRIAAPVGRHPSALVRLPSRRAKLTVVAFKSDSATVSLPLDYYTCLNVNRGASKDAVRKACDRLVHSPPDVGYSQDALFSRAVLLQSAADCLADMESRKNYEAQRRQSGVIVDVAASDLPGALALLQECGEADTVLDLGSGWLQANAGAVDAPDVAAAMALAYCEKAGEALQLGDATVAPACSCLEAALSLLQRYNLSAQLQQQIMQTLEVRCRVVVKGSLPGCVARVGHGEGRPCSACADAKWMPLYHAHAR